MRVKEESEKVSLKLNIQKTKIMASGPTTSWQIDRKTIEWERLEISSRKLEIPSEHFMQRWAQ